MVGFDINRERVAELMLGTDTTLEVSKDLNLNALKNDNAIVYDVKNMLPETMKNNGL